MLLLETTKERHIQVLVEELEWAQDWLSVYPVGLEVVYVNTPVSTTEEGIASKKASYSLKFFRSKIN